MISFVRAVPVSVVRAFLFARKYAGNLVSLKHGIDIGLGKVVALVEQRLVGGL